MRLTRSRLIFTLTATVTLAVPVGFTAAGSAAAAARSAVTGGSPQFAKAVAFDVSQPFSVLATRPGPAPDGATGDEVEPGDGPNVPDAGHTNDGALQSTAGTKLVSASLGSLWAGFALHDCTDESGDPVVMYDQVADRWILSQFTTAGPEFFNCIAVSTTGDPTGTYFRYAFSTGLNFPDYPKYGIFKDSYLITTREFGPTTEYGICVYALDRNKLLNGVPGARDVRLFLDSAVVPINLIGDGLLPAMVDGKTKPKQDAKIPIIGTQDDGGPYGATFDALNIWDLDVKWRSTPTA